MAVVQVQRATNTTGSASTIAATFPNATSTGNLLVAIVTPSNSTSQTVSSIADSQTNTWALAVSSNSQADVEIWYAYNITGGVNTVTATLSGSGNSPTIHIREFDLVSKTDPKDKTNTGTSASGTEWVTSNTATATTLPILVITGANGTINQNYTALDGFKWGLETDGAFSSLYSAYKVIGESVTRGAVTSGIGAWDCVVATFTAPSSMKINSIRPRPFAPGLAR